MLGSCEILRDALRDYRCDRVGSGLLCPCSEVGWFVWESIHPAKVYTFCICTMIDQQADNVERVFLGCCQVQGYEAVFIHRIDIVSPSNKRLCVVDSVFICRTVQVPAFEIIIGNAIGGRSQTPDGNWLQVQNAH